MIITRTPVRISLLGGGTDYPDHFRLHGGQTLGAAINKYSYLTVNRLADLFDYTIRVSYSRTEAVHDIDAIEHPAVRECLRFMKIERGIEIHYVGDLPARTGLGSSSSFTVGLLKALHALKGEMVSASQLAHEAVHVEQEMIGERVGVQDQYTCAVGGLVHLQIGRDGRVDVAPVPIEAKRLRDLQDRLLLLYTGIRRHAHDVVADQLLRTREGRLQRDLMFMAELVDQGISILASGQPLVQFGELLHACWLRKRQLSDKITTPQIDEYYERARRAGAIGGKLMGAGSGGFVLLFVEPDRQAEVLAALPALRQVPFHFEHIGSSVLFYQPD